MPLNAREEILNRINVIRIESKDFESRRMWDQLGFPLMVTMEHFTSMSDQVLVETFEKIVRRYYIQM